MLVKITTDGCTETLFETINDARSWCIGFLKNHPDTNLSLEITSGGVVRGWVVAENDRFIWKKNLGGRFCEYYIVNPNGSLPCMALDVLNGKQLYDACCVNEHMSEDNARLVERKPNQHGIKNERNVGKIFQVVNTDNWSIVRHGWTFKGVNRFTDREHEVIIYVPSRRIVDWKK